MKMKMNDLHRVYLSDEDFKFLSEVLRKILFDSNSTQEQKDKAEELLGTFDKENI